MYIPTYEDMLAAHERIKPHIRRTPVRTSDYLNELTGAQLFFKCENFQEPGAFKVRGATNAVFGLDEEQAGKGVATHSSGNHASCLSYAAMLRGIPCNVVMPHTAPQAKKDTVRRYGGKITECEPSTSSRETTFAKVQAETGGDFVHPYNDPAGDRGAGHLRERTDGTGSMRAGLRGGPDRRRRHDLGHLPDALDARPRNSGGRRRARTGRRCLSQLQGGSHHRRRCAEDHCRRASGAAEGPDLALRVEPCARHPDGTSDPDIIDAMKLTWKHLRVVMEPSSAVPLATILKNRDRFAGKRVGIIITGGNVDLDKLPWLNR